MFLSKNEESKIQQNRSNFLCTENEWMNGWMDEWMNEWMDEWMNGWMNEWMDRWTTNQPTNQMAKRRVVSADGVVHTWVRGGWTRGRISPCSPGERRSWCISHALRSCQSRRRLSDFRMRCARRLFPWAEEEKGTKKKQRINISKAQIQRGYFQEPYLIKIE